MHFNKAKILIILGIVAISGIVVFVFVKRNSIDIRKDGVDLTGMSWPESDLSGERCDNAKARPIAVMLSSDPETRPLSGIGQADLVLEMPVTEGGVTRMMAVFQCEQPKEIGSVRSARSDFIPWVQGLGAVYAHWGGEKDALTKLNAGVVDNIDAMKYEGIYYFRKKGMRPPHNGFTSSDLLAQASAKLGYNLGKSTTSYQHEEGKRPSEEQLRSEGDEILSSAERTHRANPGTTEPPVIYGGNFLVQWKYQPTTNTYRRWRGEKEEMDRNTSKPVEASNVVLLKTTWSPISQDYISVKTVGSGEAVIYKNGETIKGTWEKRGAIDRLVFYNSNRQEIKFAIGSIWIQTLIK